MASFIGTEEDFNTYIGPRIRNLVNQIITKDRDAANGVCQHCGKKSELDSVYKHGKNHRTVTKMALKDFDKGSYLDVDLMKFEELFINYHQPVAETILFLCRECHIKYDNNIGSGSTFDKKTKKVIVITLKDRKNKTGQYSDTNLDGNEENTEVRKVRNRIDRWFRNKNQINSRILYAFINLYRKFNGNVDVHNLKTESGVDTFYSNFTQMKNFGENNHGKIFEQYGDHVYLWEPVKKIVWEKYAKHNTGQPDNAQASPAPF
jgi:hypothetical protein